MRILVVEDDFISRRLLCRYLEAYGECDVAVNGREAVAAVKQALDAKENYDLICLDIMMPEMNGQEALAEVRKLEKENGVLVGHGSRIIMTTAMEDSKNVRSAFKSCADAYVVKPIEKKKFIATLQDLDLTVEIPL